MKNPKLLSSPSITFNAAEPTPTPLSAGHLSLTRRYFLGLSLAALSLEACSSSSPPNGTIGAGGVSGAGGSNAAGAAGGSLGTNDVPFGIWQQLQAAVRQSPDHLPATADRLVMQKDPAAIFAFVRDHIFAYPSSGPRDVATARRWGTRATLRAGAGTPREKVDVLVELLQRAGFQAKVVSGTPIETDGEKLAAQVYLRNVSRTFAPAVDSITLDAWNHALAQKGPPPSVEVIDSKGTELASIVSAVSSALPANLEARVDGYSPTLAVASPEELPLVALTAHGKQTYANPLFPDAVFGMSYVKFTPDDASAAAKTLSVTVELLATRTQDPMKRVSLVKKSYSAEDLVGRQLLVQTAPAVDFDTLLKSRVADVHAFVPVISVRGVDVDAATREALAAVGPVITTRGDIVQPNPDGSVMLNGKQRSPSGSMAVSAGAKAANVTIEAQADTFPTVRLHVSAFDAAGAPVTGLPAAAFRITEGSRPLGFLLSADPADPIRVLLLVDVDGPLDTGETVSDLAKQLTQQVVAAYPQAQIQVLKANGTVLSSQDPNAVAQVVADADSSDADDYLRLVSDARWLAPTVIVMVSDFQFLTEPSPAFRANVAQGAPVLMVSALGQGRPLPDDFHQIVKLSRGVELPGAGISATVKAALDFLQAHQQKGAYTLEYTAPTEGPNPRSVTVSVPMSSAQGNASYRVPAASQSLPPAALAGLYLTVTVGERSVTRTLAGYRSEKTPDPITALPDSLLQEVRDALWGSTMLLFEAAAPPISVLIDELLTAKLAMRPFWEAVQGNNTKAMRDALPTLTTFVPTALNTVRTPLPNDQDTTSLTFEHGLRVAAYTQHPNFKTGTQTKQLDILPLTQFATLAKDAGVSFQRTLARSARLSVVEAHAMPNSSAKALTGKPLVALPPYEVFPQTLTFLPEGARVAAAAALNAYSEPYRLVPMQSEFVGFWTVDANTGTLLGVLPDQTGGAGSSENCKALKDSLKALDALSVLGDVAGVTALGPYFILGKQVAKVAIAAAIILESIGDPDFNYDPDKELEALFKSAACDAATAGFGKASTANTALGVAGAPNIGCPNSGKLGCG